MATWAAARADEAVVVQPRPKPRLVRRERRVRGGVLSIAIVAALLAGSSRPTSLCFGST